MPIGEAISRLLEHPTRRLTGRELLALGPRGELLRAQGAFEEIEPLRAIRCPSCDEDHEVDLDFDQGARAYTYYCGSAGIVRATDEDIRLFRFSHEWLMARLAEGLVHPHRTPCASWFPVRSGRDASAHLRPQAER